MIDRCLGILRKNGSATLREAITEGKGNTLSYSALDCIIRSERYASFLGEIDHLVLEAPYRSDLPWDELECIRAMRHVRSDLRTTVFIDPRAHSWCKNPQLQPEGADALAQRLQNHSSAPRLFVGNLDLLTPEELAGGWDFLTQHPCYSMASTPLSPAELPVSRSFSDYLQEKFAWAKTALRGSFRSEPVSSR